ncbi:acetyl-CoA synthetase-like protein [Daedalea quercina L-15889]|uniref:Acetyl-CoA synthetase-like protein n=1 Tax=Daedalea quercina L-15889 TaxID=1314783 RepID=A0A165MZ13_9APHY|nr:acetyl-CoA synthetase-like protein [Daedalea quercina L-15889]
MPTRRAVPPAPETQALSSPTFRLPPLDGSVSFPELYDWHGIHNPGHRVFVFPCGDGSVREILYPEAARAIHVGAKIIASRMGSDADTEDRAVIGIVAASDVIPYYITEVSIMRANHIVFPISPRNSPAAIAHLIHKANIKHILVGRDHAMQNLVEGALHLLRAQYQDTAVPGTSHMPAFDELFVEGDQGEPLTSVLPFKYRGPDSPVLFLHSSGSTAFPKPIMYTDHRMLLFCMIPFYGEQDLTGIVFSMHMMPMFHGMGMALMLWTASCGLVMSTFEPGGHVLATTPKAILDAARASGSDYLFSVPAVIEAWSRDPDSVKWLSTRHGVLFGGGPLNKTVGDFMTAHGVKMFVQYGCTEGGIMSVMLPAAEPGADWEYFKLSPILKAHMEPFGDNTYEFVIVCSERSQTNVVNTKVDGIDAYATSDLLVPHPTKPGFWRVFGRVDDQIMHSTGEKTNPGPLESMLNQDPHVQASVMFGRARFQAGVLVDPKPQFKFDPANEKQVAEFRNKIWPTIERMNAFAPQHSRLFKEMILVAKPDKPFTYTAKNTARRQAVINDYEDEINALYDTVAESTQSSIPTPEVWDLVATTDFVREVVGKVLRSSVQDDDDLFQNGCDSLQATWIRNTILRALRDSAQLDTRAISGSFVYENPSITQLAEFVHSLVSGSYGGVDDSPTAKADTMRRMAEKYTADLKPGTAVSQEDVIKLDGDVVLVTGTTGSLGCFILSSLIEDSKVSKIYALNRVTDGTGTLLERQRKAFESRGLNSSLLELKRVVLLEGDTAEEWLGLQEATYDEIRHSLTHIIHNAWRVDFNLALASFEPNIKGLRRLVDLALSTARPSKLVFTSSVGILRHYEGTQPIPEVPVAAEVAIGNGYVQSKWVSEEILLRAAEHTSLRPTIVRVGQICGGKTGTWNANEWFPLMVRSCGALGCFAKDSRDVDWIPVEIAAKVICEFRYGDNASTQIAHLVHSRPVAWSSIATVVSQELSVPLLTYEEWLAKLESRAGTHPDQIDSGHGGTEKHLSMEILQEVPALRLLPFFRALGQGQRGEGNALGFPKLDTSNAVAASPTLADLGVAQVTPDVVERWLDSWRKNGYVTVKV